MLNKLKRNPILLMGLVLVVLESFATFASAQHLVPNSVLAWIQAVIVVVTAILGFVARATSTPLADPRTTDGQPAVLVPKTDISDAQTGSPAIPPVDPFPRSTKF